MKNEKKKKRFKRMKGNLKDKNKTLQGRIHKISNKQKERNSKE
jgi:hypothetical protein